MQVTDFIKKFEEENKRAVEEFLPISAQGMEVVEKMIYDYNKPYRDLLENIFNNAQFFMSAIELDMHLNGEVIYDEIEELLK